MRANCPDRRSDLRTCLEKRRGEQVFLLLITGKVLLTFWRGVVYCFQSNHNRIRNMHIL